MKRAIVVVCSWAASLCLAAAYLAIGWGIDDVAGHNAWSTWWIGVKYEAMRKTSSDGICGAALMFLLYFLAYYLFATLKFN